MEPSAKFWRTREARAMVAGAPRRMAGRAMVGAMLRQSLSLVPATIGGAYFSSGIGLLLVTRFCEILFLFLSEVRALAAPSEKALRVP